MYKLERAACGFGLTYHGWPDGVGVLLAVTPAGGEGCVRGAAVIGLATHSEESRVRTLAAGLLVQQALVRVRGDGGQQLRDRTLRQLGIACFSRE